ncbi:MAG: hypothetical protein HY886_10240 [Deltaproteobacteria bacterium]|nr:hypothetical protein [Deltaproteobacteria bacterium]
MRDYIVPIAITLVAINLLVLFSIRPYQYNVSSMLRISENEAEGVVPEYFEKGMVIFTDKGGYDGQYYYYVARDPFMQEGHFTNPYRRQRVLYPLLSNILAFGSPRPLAYSMYAVNLLSLCLGMFFFIRLLKRFDAHPYLSLFYGLSAPSMMAMLYDVPSPLSFFLIIASVYYYVDRKLFVSSAFMALAFLTREDSIMALAPLVLWDFQKERSFKRVLILAMSLLPFFLWQFFVTLKLGSMPASGSTDAIRFIPFAGIGEYFVPQIKGLGGLGMKPLLTLSASVAVFVFFTAVSVAMIAALKTRQHLFYYVVAGYCMLVLFTVASQWDNYNGLLRMFYGLFPFLVLAYCVEKRPAFKYLVWSSAALSFLAVVRILFVSPVYPYIIR